jgi:D-alanyl-D-alanine carboxypeptidase
MRIRYSLSLVALLGTLALQPLAAQPTGVFPSVIASGLSIRLAELQQEFGVVGVAASIVSSRHGSWVGAAGHADPATGDTIGHEMLFGIGSVTKTFTSALVLQLVQEGAIALNDTIGRWISGYANVNGAMTVRQLLGHTGGVYNYTRSQEFWQYTFEDLDRMIVPEKTLEFVGPADFSPGFGYSYSNTGYLLLGMLVERVTGRRLEEELARRFFTPLGLATIAMGSADSLPGEVVSSWQDLDGDGNREDLDALPRRAIFSGAWAAGGLFSSMEDLARWGHELYRGKVLSQEMMKELLTFRSVPQLGTDGGYGLGVMRGRPYSRLGWGHSGGITGFNTYLWHVPGDSVTIAVSINQGSTAATQIALRLLNEYFDLSPQVSSAPATPAAASTLVPRPNSFTDVTSIALSAARSANGSVRVYSLLGTPVRTLVDGVIDEGAHTLTWDGRDAAGDELASGTYLVRMQIGGEMVTRRVVKQ